MDEDEEDWRPFIRLFAACSGLGPWRRVVQNGTSGLRLVRSAVTSEGAEQRPRARRPGKVRPADPTDPPVLPKPGDHLRSEWTLAPDSVPRDRSNGQTRPRDRSNS